MSDMINDKIIERNIEIRKKALSKFGDVDQDMMLPNMNPALMGGPEWPAFRQAWRTVRTAETTIVVSDGLSDPSSDGANPLGFNLEVCAEARGHWNDIRDSWLFDLVFQVRQLVAHFGNVDDLLKNYRTLSSVVSVYGVPESWENWEGKVGFLLGFPSNKISNEIELVNGKIRLLAIKLLHPDELDFIEAENSLEEQRNKLVTLFDGDHFCSVERQPIIKL